MVETLGAAKILAILKGTATGLASAIPAMIHNSALASDQLTSAAMPITAKIVTSFGAGLAALSALGAKGAAAAKSILAPAAAKTTATATAAKGATVGTSATQAATTASTVKSVTDAVGAAAIKGAGVSSAV